jgi:hypothetical protein
MVNLSYGPDPASSSSVPVGILEWVGTPRNTSIDASLANRFAFNSKWFIRRRMEAWTAPATQPGILITKVLLFRLVLSPGMERLPTVKPGGGIPELDPRGRRRHLMDSIAVNSAAFAADRTRAGSLNWLISQIMPYQR